MTLKWTPQLLIDTGNIRPEEHSDLMDGEDQYFVVPNGRIIRLSGRGEAEWTDWEFEVTGMIRFEDGDWGFDVVYDDGETSDTMIWDETAHTLSVHSVVEPWTPIYMVVTDTSVISGAIGGDTREEIEAWMRENHGDRNPRCMVYSDYLKWLDEQQAEYDRRQASAE
jgi:hypothetical protein